MRKAMILGLTAGTILLAGCKKEDSSDSSLTISIGPSAPYILPVSDRSCKGRATGSTSNDLSANTIEFTRFNYKWTGDGTYTMSAIFLRFRSSLFSGGKFECVLSSDELDYILPTGGRVLDPSEKNEEKVARCSLRCGGITINGNIASANIPGTIKIVGIETDSDGNSRPIVTEEDIALTYEKF